MTSEPEVEERDEAPPFHDFLAEALPAGEEFTLIHIHSFPHKTRKLIFTSRNDKRLDAVTTHYFVLTHGDVAVIALELLAYESPDTYTLFVSKADTTGHYARGRLDVMAVVQALIRGTLRYYFFAPKRIRIALFAKAEGQYLFLGSVKNPRKHVLTDAQLVKWWLRCLDGLSGEFQPVREGKCTLAIPGIDDPRALASYYPASPSLPWSAGDIFWEGDTASADDDTLAVKRIPRFPDDPKSRFLDSLVADQRAKFVSRKQYFVELESRQEFRLTKAVGLIGLEGHLRPEQAISINRQEGAVSAKDCHRFKELLISLNFESLESTESGTKRLLEGVADAAKISVKGTRVPIVKAQPTPDKRVNVLTANMVRKKRRT